MRQRAISLLVGAGLGCAALAAPAEPEPGARIKVNVVAGQPKEQYKRVAQAMAGEVPAAATFMKTALHMTPGLVLDEKEPEVVVTVEQVGHQELGRATDASGKEVLQHRYTGRGTIEVAGERVPLAVSHDINEGAGSLRLDSVEYHTVASNLAERAAGLILDRLDALRPQRAQAGFTQRDLRVKAVEPGGPAEKAGLKVEDRIRRIDAEKKGGKMQDRIAAWWMEKAGTKVALEIERDKQRQTVELVLQPRSAWGQ